MRPGYEANLYYQSTSGSGFTELGRCTLIELEYGAPAIDAISHDSAGYREHIGGVRDWNLGTGFFLVDDSTSQLDMFSALNDRTLMYWRVQLSSDAWYEGDGYVNRWSAQAPTDDAIKARLSVRGSGFLAALEGVEFNGTQWQTRDGTEGTFVVSTDDYVQVSSGDDGWLRGGRFYRQATI